MWQSLGWPGAREPSARPRPSLRGAGSAPREAPPPQVPLFLQVFEEEHHILYLDHGGVIVAVKDSSIPLKTLK